MSAGQSPDQDFHYGNSRLKYFFNVENVSCIIITITAIKYVLKVLFTNNNFIFTIHIYIYKSICRYVNKNSNTNMKI